VLARFDIADAPYTFGLPKWRARDTTKEILAYARAKYTQASKVVVKGRLFSKVAYGNLAANTVLDVFYERATLDTINFEGIDNNNIWAIRDGGQVHPELQ
jgi:hypothetical protein